jgi:predicted dehydrogenase
MSNEGNIEITRRAALGEISRRVAAVTAAPLLLKNGQEKKLGWAIVGLGGLTLGEILPGFKECKFSRVTALVSGDPSKAKRVADQYNVKRIYNYDNFDTLKNDPDVDIVYIVLPNGMHAEYTIRALKAGKHVLCEKPMANTVQECQQMIATAKAANRKLMIAYRCQYEPYNMAAIELCKSGALGNLKEVISDHGFSIGDPRQWRLNRKLAGGGSLMDIGIYSLNAARYLTGEEPVSVSAMSYTTPNDPRFKEVEETVNFMLRFPSGCLANCTSSYGYEGTNRIRVVGDKGFLDMEPATSYRGIRLRYSANGKYEEKKFETGSQFALEMDALSQNVLNASTPRTPGEEGLADMKWITAIYESVRSGRTLKS